MTELKATRNFGLDLLRALAILGVLVMHSFVFWPINGGYNFPKLFNFGWAGVDLFFVLSGYLIASQIFGIKRSSEKNQSFQLREFWYKRWMRTFPLYFIVLMVYIFIKPLLGFPFRDNRIPYFIFLQNYLEPHDFIQSWSLCVEEQFYLIFPLLVLFLPKKITRASFWLLPMVFSILCRLVIWNRQSQVEITFAAYALQFPTHTHLDGISVGVFLAASKSIWSQWPLQSKKKLGLFGVVVLLLDLTFASPFFDDISCVWTFTVFAIGFGSLIPWALTWQLGPKLIAKPIQLVALWSYGLYLWNNLVFRQAEHLHFGLLSRAVFGWSVSFLLAAITFYGIESPVLQWRDRYLKSLQ